MVATPSGGWVPWWMDPVLDPLSHFAGRVWTATGEPRRQAAETARLWWERALDVGRDAQEQLQDFFTDPVGWVLTQVLNIVRGLVYYIFGLMVGLVKGLWAMMGEIGFAIGDLVRSYIQLAGGMMADVIMWLLALPVRVYFAFWDTSLRVIEATPLGPVAPFVVAVFLAGAVAAASWGVGAAYGVATAPRQYVGRKLRLVRKLR